MRERKRLSPRGKTLTLRFRINGAETFSFFVIFADTPAAYFDPPFTNFSNFTRDYKEVHK